MDLSSPAPFPASKQPSCLSRGHYGSVLRFRIYAVRATFLGLPAATAGCPRFITGIEAGSYQRRYVQRSAPRSLSAIDGPWPCIWPLSRLKGPDALLPRVLHIDPTTTSMVPPTAGLLRGSMGTRLGSKRASRPITAIVTRGVSETSAPMREASIRLSDSAKLR